MLVYKIDEHILLRMFNEKDAEEFYQLIMSSKKCLREWLGWLDDINGVLDTVKFIKNSLKELEKHGGTPTVFAIIYQGKIAGIIGFNTIDKLNRNGTIGYWLGEAFQRRGIMTKSLKAVITYGFKELELNKITIAAAVENEKSRALPERFKFVEEGRLRQAEWLYDHFVDHVVYGLLAEEWSLID